MIDLVKIVFVAPQSQYRLSVSFSDGSSGVFDFADMISKGGQMVEPLRDQVFFKRVFIEFGVLAWPNGFDIDAIALHQDMKKLGLLAKAA